MYEVLDIYDKNRNKLSKTVERKEGTMLQNNEYVIAVHCWIVNSDNKILVTQRALHKKRGGRWECTGGLKKSGETSLEAIKRELYEEIGININTNELKLQSTYTEDREKVSFIRDIYILNKNISLSDFHFNDGEVIDCKYVTRDELKMMTTTGELDFSLNTLIKHKIL